jgi:predicted nucleic acid-binding protein
MLIYLDTVVAIYSIEGSPVFMARADSRILAALSAGDKSATSDLTRLERSIHPLRRNDAALLANFFYFLDQTNVLALPPEVYDDAARIRAIHNYSTSDSLHLAAAVAGACDLFLTNDARLAGFPDLSIEILP